MKRSSTYGFATVSTPRGGFSAPPGPAIVGSPVASGKVTIGGTLSVSATANNKTESVTYQWKRGSTAITNATGSTYTPTASDIGFDITCVVTANKGAKSSSKSSNALTYALTQVTGLKYAYAGNSNLSGVLSTIEDLSGNGRTLTASGSSFYPGVMGFPRNWAQNGQPVYGFDNVNTQTALDVGPSSASYADFLNQPGMGVVFRGQAIDGNGGIIFGNTTGTTNANGMTLIFDTTNYQLKFAKTSTSGSGTSHISYNTPTNSIKAGDVFQFSFMHNSDATWSIKIIKEARTPSDTRTTITSSGTSLPNAVTGSAYGLSLGSSPTKTLGTAMRMQNLLIFSASSNMASDVADWEAYCNNKFNFSFLAFDNNASATFTTANLVSFINWNPTTAAAAATQARILEQSASNDLGLSGSSVKVGVIGDQRAFGAGATLGTNDYRHMIQVASASINFTRVAVGPITDATTSPAKNHFCVNNNIIRTSLSPAKNGYSQRTPDAGTIDNYVGPGKAYNDIKIWNWVQGGQNWQTATLILANDDIDELARVWEYCIAQQQATAGITPGFILQTLNVHRTNIGGILQHNIRNYNREMHAMVAYMRSRGYIVKFGNLNKEDVNP